MAQVNFRVDDQVKHDADELFDGLGVSLSAAITIFLRRSIARRGFPFPVAEAPKDGTANCYYDFVQSVPQYISPEDEKVARQRAAMLKFAGRWKDDRSTDEIIRDIESHRTKGRKVEL